ncbi:hypothetical protein C5748_12105 [Phyllobacterium phragmitis]|uniref:DNA repair protein n=1 Tax=Phyllobacterium phragmitis TaxID=2670329 RepID=A0A2S9ISC8_9HYPH|nr:hypothetical protein [Phyllobacterium phragmitis]PRD43425.1 hypothetical protein C5748_12105 [Phyllobacterium phragmitis]
MSTVDLSALRRAVAAIDGKDSDRDGSRRSVFASGFAEADQAFAGGLPRGALHEIFAAETGDAGAATGFALALALRASDGVRPVVWLEEDVVARESGGIYPPGLAALGFDPSRLLVVRCPSARDVLRGASDALEVAGIGAVMIAPWGTPKCLDLTVSRRLQLAAREADAPAFLLMHGNSPGGSAALTRWRIAAAPSQSSGARAPGRPAFDVALLRNRQGTTGHWIMEWNIDENIFRHVEALSGTVVPAPFHGPAAARKSVAQGR